MIIQYQLSTNYACGIVSVDKDNFICEPIAPIFRKMLGRNLYEVLNYLKNHGKFVQLFLLQQKETV